ncbi:MAG: bifunctional riboflavin kinase/FAD synthetase [Bacteroidales bacterium]|nr:bifunctional riboflavin kinase/FAD synthetase [Bacteroidales bacterium]
MKIYKNFEDVPALKYAVVTVGTFDGLHIGHRHIITRMRGIADEKGGETVVVTFYPHPRLVLYPDSRSLKFVNTREQKYGLFREYGIDHLVEIPFTREFAARSSEEFIRESLVEGLKVKSLIIGYDHHFGKNREGNIVQLRKFAGRFGFFVEEIPAKFMDGIAVSSTQIRNALEEGNLVHANRMLGYEFSLAGKVVKGDGIGQGLGFPTANIKTGDADKLLPGNGVYACRVRYEGKTYQGICNMGSRPTLGSGGFSIEVHLFDFDMNIYGKNLTLFFIAKIRDEKKFDNLEELRLQIGRDKLKALKIFGEM